ncbi:hypothetical protein IFM89_038548 [Coptis chinensis]|uniref:Uncharacterized protein n=1 Tax=Coptis chinensis TaxID=261450 RepID=A0A835LQ41_9MAGN|nr:hypothetical protein IFM89_038548 [Coptis chinensis]
MLPYPQLIVIAKGDCFDWMEKDSRSRLHQQSTLWQSPNLDYTSTLSYLGQGKPFLALNPSASMTYANGSLPGVAVPVLPTLKSQGNEERQKRLFQPLTNPYGCVVSTNESLSVMESLGLPYFKISQRIDERKWFYCVPHHCKTGNPAALNTVVQEKLSTPCNSGVNATSNMVPGSVQKEFFVLDQSGNRGNLILHSLIGSSSQNLNLARATDINACGLRQKELEAKRDLNHPWPVIYDELDENGKANEESEMHENTEELDALLYSDDSDCDDEETSTAHSPSELTGFYNKREEMEGSTDEVTSSFCATKRKRLADEESLLGDTASSFTKCEDDAQSSCFSGKTEGEPYCLEANKHLRRERICDTMNILQNIIPGGKGKDAVVILDEAVQYLRFLKHKAESLGVAMD